MFPYLHYFRVRNFALRLKQNKKVSSVFVKNDRVSVLIPGRKRYVPVENVDELRELVNPGSRSEDSSVFFDALSVNASVSSQC